MKKGLIFSVMLVCLLAFSLLVVGCGTTSASSSSGADSSSFPKELQRKWNQVGGMSLTASMEIADTILTYNVNWFNPMTDVEETFSYELTLAFVSVIEGGYEFAGWITSSNLVNITEGAFVAVKAILDSSSGYLTYTGPDSEEGEVIFN